MVLTLLFSPYRMLLAAALQASRAARSTTTQPAGQAARSHQMASTLPVALSCGATSKSNLPTFADAAAQQQNFTAPSFPAGADAAQPLSAFTCCCKVLFLAMSGFVHAFMAEVKLACIRHAWQRL